MFNDKIGASLVSIASDANCVTDMETKFTPSYGLRMQYQSLREGRSIVLTFILKRGVLFDRWL